MDDYTQDLLAEMDSESESVSSSSSIPPEFHLPPVDGTSLVRRGVEACSVCGGDTAGTLACGHHICTECAGMWATKRLPLPFSCPECRATGVTLSGGERHNACLWRCIADHLGLTLDEVCLQAATISARIRELVEQDVMVETDHFEDICNHFEIEIYVTVSEGTRMLQPLLPELMYFGRSDNRMEIDFTGPPEGGHYSLKRENPSIATSLDIVTPVEPKPLRRVAISAKLRFGDLINSFLPKQAGHLTVKPCFFGRRNAYLWTTLTDTQIESMRDVIVPNGHGASVTSRVSQNVIRKGITNPHEVNALMAVFQEEAVQRDRVLGNYHTGLPFGMTPRALTTFVIMGCVVVPMCPVMLAKIACLIYKSLHLNVAWNITLKKINLLISHASTSSLTGATALAQQASTIRESCGPAMQVALPALSVVSSLYANQQERVTTPALSTISSPICEDIAPVSRARPLMRTTPWRRCI